MRGEIFSLQNLSSIPITLKFVHVLRRICNIVALELANEPKSLFDRGKVVSFPNSYTITSYDVVALLPCLR